MRAFRQSRWRYFYPNDINWCFSFIACISLQPSTRPCKQGPLGHELLASAVHSMHLWPLSSTRQEENETGIKQNINIKKLIEIAHLNTLDRSNCVWKRTFNSLFCASGKWINWATKSMLHFIKMAVNSLSVTWTSSQTCQSSHGT